MPCSQKQFAVFFNQPLNPVQLNATKSAAVLQPYRVGPKFRIAPVALDVNVWRLVAVARVKEKAIWADA